MGSGGVVKKVLILVETHGEGLGAEEVLLQMLKAGSMKGFSVALSICAPLGSRVYEAAKEMGYEVLSFGVGGKGIAHNIRALIKLRPTLFRFDIVHAWSARSFELVRIMGLLSKVKVSGTLHDHPHAPFHSSIRKYLMKWGVRGFDRLVCVSSAVKEACKVVGYKIDYEVIHNGLCEISTKRTRDSDGLIHVGFLGMYAKWKGFGTIVPWVRASDRSVRWHFFGETNEDYIPVQEQLQKKLGSRVSFHGRKSQEEIYSAIDVLIQPSTFFDPLPTTLLESARSGIPVIARSVGGVDEIVQHGHTGFIYENDDEGLLFLKKLCLDRDLRQEMGRKARIHWEDTFPVRKMLNEYVTLWEDM